MHRDEELAVDDLESLGMTLGKRLGRLEISSVEVVERLVILADRCEVMEEAVVEVNDARETDGVKLKQMDEKLNKLENIIKISEEKVKENEELKSQLCKMKEEQVGAMEEFLQLVEKCQGFEIKIDRIEKRNVELLEAVEDLEKDKERLIKSLPASNTTQLTSSEPISTSAVCYDSTLSPTSLNTTSGSVPSTTSSTTTLPLFRHPPPSVGVPRRRPATPLFQVMLRLGQS